MNYYIFRHGETIARKGISHYNDQQLTTGILPEGAGAIEKMAHYLKEIKTDHNAASELLRVQQTVEIIENITNKHFVKDSRLNELLDENNLEPPYPFTGYLDGKVKQLNSFINEMKRENYKSVLIGTHGYIIASLKRLLTDKEVTADNLNDFPKPGVLTIIKDKTIKEVDFN